MGFERPDCSDPATAGFEIVRRHHAMSIVRKVSIRLGVLVLLASAAFLLFVYAARTSVVSRVPIPGSPMTAVVTADVSGCYKCQLFEHGHPISDPELLGPYASRSCSLTRVAGVSNVVTIGWADHNYHYIVLINMGTRRFGVISDSVPLR